MAKRHERVKRMEHYKVCILAAGVGNRMGVLSKHINTSILPVNFKAAISYHVEKFPKEVEIVIAVGHKKETVINYLSLAHPERKFTFVAIDEYMGPGAGPGHSLLQCKEHLQCPFVLCVADTLILEDIPVPDKNWFGIAPVKKTEDYCTVKIKNNLVFQLDDKIKTDNKFAFLGLAGIYDHETFFASLEKNKEIKSGEVQVSNGFRGLIENKLIPVGFTWFDTGTLDNYMETNKNFSGSTAAFDFSKGDEFIYFVNGRVVKFFADQDIASKRCERALHLKGLCPEIEKRKDNFYSYKRIDGQVLYDVLNTQIVHDFLQWIKFELWKKIDLSDEEKKEFSQACKRFYQEKTIQRVEMFYDKKGLEDTPNIINGVRVPALKELLAKINWEEINNGIPSNFHGDLQFDNIIVTRDPSSNLQKFILLDWRQDFGGMTQFGDLYYDLAKLYGGLTISYKLIKEGKFTFDMSGTSVYYNFAIKNDLLDAKEEYESFLSRNKFDLRKIKILRALIYLNMSPLHHDPFDLLIYYMGKLMLYKALMENGDYA